MNKVLYIRLPMPIHNEIKRLAAFKYVTMEKWALQAVVEKLVQEKKCLQDNKIP